MLASFCPCVSENWLPPHSVLVARNGTHEPIDGWTLDCDEEGDGGDRFDWSVRTVVEHRHVVQTGAIDCAVRRSTSTTWPLVVTIES